MVPMGTIKTAGVSEMNCNMVEHVVGVDLIVTWHDAGLDLGGKRTFAGCKNVCVDTQIYKFVYSKKCSGASRA
jgi:hypothetical protein